MKTNVSKPIAFEIEHRNTEQVNNPYQKWVLTLDGQIAVIDAYVICNAYHFSAQVDHSIKKLLALGVRSGGKSIIQDLVEARNQLDMEITRQTALQEVR
jgi:hypothetical protein